MFPIKRRSGQAGFTLIEMLLASALLLTAGVTAAGFLDQGVKIFIRLSASSREEAAAVFLARLTRDLRSASDYSLIPFIRGEQEVSFAALENISDREGDPDPMPYQVVYRFDPEASRIVRTAVRGQIFERAGSVQTETVLSGVRSLMFDYTGEPDGIPARVTARVDYGDLFGQRSVSRDVLLPAAPARSDLR